MNPMIPLLNATLFAGSAALVGVLATAWFMRATLAEILAFRAEDNAVDSADAAVLAEVRETYAEAYGRVAPDQVSWRLNVALAVASVKAWAKHLLSRDPQPADWTLDELLAVAAAPEPGRHYGDDSDRPDDGHEPRHLRKVRISWPWPLSELLPQNARNTLGRLA